MHISSEAKKRIAALIEKRGLSLAPIAKEIGTSYSTLWNFVHGETENFGKIQHLADVLEVSLDWIQNGSELPDPRQRFIEKPTARYNAGEHLYKAQFEKTIPLSVGVELALKAAMREGKKPPDEVLDFVRESLYRIAAGAKKPLTESEFIEYAKGFLAMKR